MDAFFRFLAVCYVCDEAFDCHGAAVAVLNRQTFFNDPFVFAGFGAYAVFGHKVFLFFYGGLDCAV